MADQDRAVSLKAVLENDYLIFVELVQVGAYLVEAGVSLKEMETHLNKGWDAFMDFLKTRDPMMYLKLSIIVRTHAIRIAANMIVGRPRSEKASQVDVTED